MASFLKSKLKAARDAISKKDYKSAQEAASQVLEYEPTNYNANVFLGLACLELGDYARSENAYMKAIDSSPDQALAWQGISKFYERTERWKDFADALRHLMDIFAGLNDSVRCAEMLQKYIELRRARGTREQVIDALSLLLSNSPLYATLGSLPEAEPTAPTSPIFAIQVSVQNNLPVLEEIVALTEKEEEEKIKKEVDRRRMRLGDSRPEEIKKEVGREVWNTSTLPSMYNEILNHPRTNDDLRRTTESKLLRLKHQHLKSVTTSRVDAKSKAQLLSEVESLSSGMVLLGLPDELAWTIFFESKEDFDILNLRRFFDIFPSSPMTRLFKGYFKYKRMPISLVEEQELERDPDKSFQNALETDPFDVVLAAFSGLQNSLLAHRVLSDIYHLESDHENAIKIAESGVELVDRFEVDYGRALPRVRREFMTVLSTGLVHLFPPKHHLKALKILDDILHEDPDNIQCIMGRGYVLQYSAQWPEAETMFARIDELRPNIDIALEAREERAWCKVKLGKLEEGASDLRLVIEDLDEEEGKEYQKARAWWRLGSSLWLSGAEGREKAYTHFITSLKRSSNFAPAFTSLGIYYAEVASPPDLDRSSKCFQKAFELDAREAEAARRLAAGFAEEREWDLVEVVAHRTIEGEGGLEGGKSSRGEGTSGRHLPTNAWAWKALGVVEINRRNYASATRAFQVALRADQDDFMSWKMLGESYAKSGRHAASIKALQRAMDLKTDDWMCRYLMGEVHRQMGQYQSAIDGFEGVLKIHPEEISVLFSLAETYLIHGRTQFSEGFLARSEASFIASLSTALDIFDKSPGFRRIAWKTAADCVFEISKIVSFNDKASVQNSLTSLASLITFSETDDFVGSVIDLPLMDNSSNIDGFFAAQLAVAAYGYLISLGTFDGPATASAWFDLGVSLSQFSRHTEDDTKSTRALQEAGNCFQKAVGIDPGNCDYWNALGKHNFVENPKLSQHAYISALEYDPKSTLSWINLGLLYLYHGDAELANEALFRAQTLDPDVVLAWVGQGLVATANGHNIESTALFGHASSLSAAIPVADLEYAKRAFENIARTRTNFSKELLLPPFHALERYCKQRPNDSAALHMFGLLCERLNQLDLAIDLVMRSIALLERSYEKNEDTLIEQHFAFANGNLGRLRLSTGDYSGAVEAFSNALSLLSAEAGDPQTKTLRAHAQFGSGLAQFKLGELEGALAMFEAALEELPAGMVDVRSHVTILLSQALWALGSDEARKTAQGQLLECISVDPENLTAMTSLVAMGILECDDALVDAALSEIQALAPDKRAELDPEYIVPRLLVKHHLSQRRQREALAEAQRAVHERPLDDTSRTFLASLLLQRGDPAAASSIVASDRMSLDCEAKDEVLRVAAVAAAVHTDTRRRALRLAQKAVVLAPWSKNNWRALAFIRCTVGGSAARDSE